MKGEEYCLDCGQECSNDNYDIETPNHLFELCLDCAMNIEDELYSRYKKVIEKRLKESGRE